jgi:tetratricopeptide (TPR) repeat protein
MNTKRTGAIADIRLIQEALDATPDNHLDWARQLQSLGVGYHDRYRQIGDIADLETAIQLFQETFHATPDNHPHRASRLQDIGTRYYDRYHRIEVMADLESAIQRFQEALNATSDNHPDRAGRLYGLGTGYRDKYYQTGAMADLEMAIQYFQEVVSRHSSRTLVRHSGKTSVALYTKVEQWSLAYQTTSITVSLIPLLTPYSLSNSDKQYLLIDMVGLAFDTAAVALMVGKNTIRGYSTSRTRPWSHYRFSEQITH